VVEISWRLPGRMPSIPNIRMGVLHRIIGVGMTRPSIEVRRGRSGLHFAS
jgi:hypothetical protein